MISDSSTLSTDALPSPPASPPVRVPLRRDTLEAGRQPLESERPAKVGERRRRMSQGICWPIAFWIGMLHVGALAAPFFFSWQAVVVTVLLHWVTGGIGICLGYHRLLTHSSFQTYRPVRWLLAVLGGLAGEGPAIGWVADHRRHHAHSDTDEDPHSPHDGSWWSHMFWFAWNDDQQQALSKKWAPDLTRDPVMVWIARMFLPSHFLLGAVLLAIGTWLGGWAFGLSLMIWGAFVRTVFVLHCTWFVNSASHIWGYRNYPTRDDSRNNWWVALLSYGEGWHNNHHAYPRMAPHGHKWWEFDLTYQTIRLMKLCGLAWDVVDYKRVSDRTG